MAAVSVADICNIALTKLGTSRIVALSDKTENGVLCNLLYEHSRDAALRSFQWSCAVERAELGQDTSTPITDDWDYQYLLPNDCLRMLDMPNLPAAAWEIAGRFLMTSESEVFIRYIKQVTDTTIFDSELVIAIAYRLAADAAYKITHSRAKEEEMETLFRRVVLDAKGTTRQELAEDAAIAEWKDAF